MFKVGDIFLHKDDPELTQLMVVEDLNALEIFVVGGVLRINLDNARHPTAEELDVGHRL